MKPHPHPLPSGARMHPSEEAQAMLQNADCLHDAQAVGRA
jgi:hypothetical protein